MAVFIHQLANWPKFFWDQEAIEPALHQAQFSLGHLLGRLADLGFSTRSTIAVQELSETIVRSAEIEGEILNLEEVRSSIAKRLGITWNAQ
jgi:Fic family protein